MKTQSIRSEKGFTLIELLVAMAITTVIITILVSITSLSLDTWNRSRSEIRAARQGKAMIDSLSKDFESMVVRKGNNFEWLSAKYKPSNEGPKGNASPNAAELIFFSAATDRYDGQIGVTGKDLGGDVSTIGYQLAYKDPIGSAASKEEYNTFVLYRKLVDPKETFETILGQTDLDGKIDFGSSGGNVVSAEENFICENIYQFTVTFHIEITETTGTPPNTTTTTQAVAVPIGQGSAATQEFAITGSGIVTTFSTPVATNNQIKSGKLTSVEISLTVLTDFGLAQMRRRTLAGSDKDEFIAKNSFHFSKLIPVPGS